MRLNLYTSKPVTAALVKKYDIMTDKSTIYNEVPTVGIRIKQEPDVDLSENPCANGPFTNIHVKEEIEDVEDGYSGAAPEIYDNDFKVNRSEFHNTYGPARKIKLEPIDVPVVHIKKEMFDNAEDSYLIQRDLHFGDTESSEYKDDFMSTLENEIDAFKIQKLPYNIEQEKFKVKQGNCISNKDDILTIKQETHVNESFNTNKCVYSIACDKVNNNYNDKDKPDADILNLCMNQMVNVFMKIKGKPRQKAQNKRKKAHNGKPKIKNVQLEYTGRKLKRDSGYFCDLCGRRFSLKQSLARHIQLPHVQPRAKLTQPLAQSCELTPDLIRSELDNLTRHGKEVDRKCIICLKSFDRKGCAKRHLIEHIVSNCRAASRYQCPLCDAEQFLKVDDFKHHMRVHASLTTYKCRICNKSFGDSSNFSKHKKVHGSTHGQCSMCNRKFRTAKMMELHMEHHKHIKPMKCPKCDRIFYFESVLKKHLKGAHAKRESLEPKSYRCCECDQRFVSLKQKWLHQWSAHSVRKRRVDCWVCDARFRIVTDLRSHLAKSHEIFITCKKIAQKQNKDPVPSLTP